MEILDKMFALMSLHPLVSIILSFVLAGLALVIFRAPLIEWLRKKLKLYTPEEIGMAIDLVVEDQAHFGREVDEEYLSMAQRVLFVLDPIESKYEDLS